MEFDQLIFKRVLQFFNKRKKVDPKVLAKTVKLEDLSGKLNIIARALTGKAIEVVGSEREGGWRDKVFFLPSKVALFDDIEYNVAFYTFRLFYLSSQMKLGHNWTGRKEKSTAESQQKALDSSTEVLAELFSDFPLLKDVHQKIRTALIAQHDPQSNTEPDLSWLYGRWMRNSPDEADSDELKNISEKARKSGENKITTEIKAQQADEIEVLQVDKKAQEDYVLSHNFEKVETIDEVNGSWRDFDGDDNLKEESDALNEFNLSKVVRVDDPVHSVYQAEFIGNANIAESTSTDEQKYSISYPEWDYSSQRYKANFCKVYHKKLIRTKPDYYHQTLVHNRSVLLKLKKIFARMNNDREQVRRLISGEEIDLDTLTDRFADLKSGQCPDERVYMSRRKRKKNLSILFLLDFSLSSDGYAKGNRIIDIEKQVSILFGEVLNEYGVDFQIDGFYSKTRNHSSYITVKAFDEPWNKAKMRIGAFQPSGYTRIGPAIRHATTLLKKRSQAKKWLILISDGKPNDYDRYEGKYGIQDIKQAIREMGPHGINNFALAIEEQAKYYLPQMFGPNHYDILSSPVEMVHSLAKLYQRIEKNR